MKLLVLVIGYKDPICENYIHLVKNTWAKYQNEKIKILYVYGDNDRNELRGDTIYVKAKDLGLENIYEKLLDSFEVAYKEMDFDIILRVTLNGYFRLNLLYKILSKYDLTNFYGSTFDHPLDSGCFSGCTMMLSRDVIEKLLENRHIPNPKTKWDDEGIEFLLKKIYPQYKENYKNFKRLDLLENSTFRLLDPRFKIFYDNIWAFRCKTSDRNMDLEKIKILHKIFYE